MSYYKKNCVIKKQSPKNAVEPITALGNLRTELGDLKDDIRDGIKEVTGLENSLKRAKIELNTLQIKARYMAAAITELEEAELEEVPEAFTDENADDEEEPEEEDDEIEEDKENEERWLGEGEF